MRRRAKPKEHKGPTLWVNTKEGKAEIYAKAVFVAECEGTERFITKDGEWIVGRLVTNPLEEYCDLTVAHIPTGRIDPTPESSGENNRKEIAIP